MKRSVPVWQLAGFAATSLGGTLLHYVYDLLGKSAWIAPFSGVNESTWEHMKLLFWPMLLYAVIESLFFRDYPHFWCVQCRGILLGLLLIPVLFYTYNGAVGRSPDWLNITIFFVAAAVAYLWQTRALRTPRVACPSARIAQAVLLTLALLFVLFTFMPPEIGLFRDPVTGAYGR